MKQLVTTLSAMTALLIPMMCNAVVLTAWEGHYINNAQTEYNKDILASSNYSTDIENWEEFSTGFIGNRWECWKIATEGCMDLMTPWVKHYEISPLGSEINLTNLLRQIDPYRAKPIHIYVVYDPVMVEYKSLHKVPDVLKNVYDPYSLDEEIHPLDMMFDNDFTDWSLRFSQNNDGEGRHIFVEYLYVDNADIPQTSLENSYIMQFHQDYMKPYDIESIEGARFRITDEGEVSIYSIDDNALSPTGNIWDTVLVETEDTNNEYSSFNEYKITSIDENAFTDAYYLTKISLPGYLNKIAKNAFPMQYLDELSICQPYSGDVIVPELHPQAFGDMDHTSFIYSNCTLNVPKGHAQSFREAEGWKNFKKIVEYEPWKAGVDSTDANEAATDEWHSLSGIRLDNPPTKAGLYIRRADGKTTKIMVK